MEEYNNSNYVEVTNNSIIKTFFRMFLGLLATALIAIYSYKTGLYMNISFGILNLQLFCFFHYYLENYHQL